MSENKGTEIVEGTGEELLKGPPAPDRTPEEMSNEQATRILQMLQAMDRAIRDTYKFALTLKERLDKLEQKPDWFDVQSKAIANLDAAVKDVGQGAKSALAQVADAFALILDESKARSEAIGRLRAVVEGTGADEVSEALRVFGSRLDEMAGPWEELLAGIEGKVKALGSQVAPLAAMGSRLAKVEQAVGRLTGANCGAAIADLDNRLRAIPDPNGRLLRIEKTMAQLEKACPKEK